ncbi:MAG TPA: ABC transporter substrate-binding protein [Trebonia sp.]|nr:ABC transporter substrate-binding protein [Trebonia sp.]
MTPAPSRFPAKAIAATAIVVLAAGLLAGCTGSAGTTGSASESAGPITIGASLSLDGPRSADGVAFQRGYELWASDVNAHGGLLGRQVKLKILNDHSSPTQVVTNYGTLIGQDKVDLTFGPYSTLLTTPASAVAARYGYAFVEGAGGAPAVFDTPLNQADRDVFDVSQPVADSMKPLVNYIESLPASQRPKTAAFPYTEDPFAAPPVQLAETLLKSIGIKTYSFPPFVESPATDQAAAQAVASAKADIVVLGSTDVPMVAEFMKVFEEAHYNPKMFVAATGPDQGGAFTSAVGVSDATGMMVPNGWFGSFDNAQSRQMVKEYIARYHGTVADVNADVAEAYSVGQVMAQAVTATGGLDNAKIISYLHSGVTLQSVQGPVMFDALGENSKAAGFMFQWNNGDFVQALDTNGTPTAQFIASKPAWATG